MILSKHISKSPVSNKVVARRSYFFQPKLTINQPNDIYEQEADAVAEKVLRMPDKERLFFQPKPLPVSPVQRKCEACEEDEKVQMKGEGNAGGGMIAPAVVNNVINSGGNPLDAGTKDFMESRFGYDFDNVQVHNDSLAHQSSSEINALAYTYGNHVVFGNGNYQPNTNSGKQLLAHELAHVVQQSNFIQPYRDRKSKDSIHFGKADNGSLVEDSFIMKTDKETKPWIELITINLSSQKKDGYDSNYWTGNGIAKYYDNPVKWPDLSLSISAGSAEVGNTTKGEFKVTRIEGVGYNSSKYSGEYEPASRKGRGRRYAKDLQGNMNFAVFYHKAEALHSGPLELSSHGCVHVDWTDETNMQQLNYHSVIGHTKVVIKYP